MPQALSDAHTYVFEERSRYLALQSEHETLRLQAADDQQRISHLLAVAQPVEQEIRYFDAV